MAPKEAPGDWIERADALREKWEREGRSNLLDLRGLLVFHGGDLPGWLYDALIELIDRQLPKDVNKDWRRWMMVCWARSTGLTWQASYDEASVRLDGSDAHGSSGTMKLSYQKIQRRLSKKRKAG
jgi:hypothetical protein